MGTLSYLSSTFDAWSRLDFFAMAVPLLVYALLIALYAMFVWHFYKSIGKRDLFQLNIQKGKTWKSALKYACKYLVGFPVFTFIWFAALSLMLALLSKSQPTDQILLISMALIAAIRASAYYREGIAEDVAKVLPLGVLAIFVADPTYFSLHLTVTRFYEFPGLVPLLIDYLLFTVVLEFILRFLFLAKRSVIRKAGKTKPKKTKKKN